MIRGKWRSTDAQGRETACLLAALDPKRIDSASACPARWLPPWLAQMTPSLDDKTSLEAWPEVIRRYQRILHHIHLLTPEGSERAKWRNIDAALSIAEPHDTAGVVAPVRALVARAIAGDMPSQDEWAAAVAAAEAAVAAAEVAAAEAWDRIAYACLGALEQELGL